MTQVSIPTFETDRLILRAPNREDWPTYSAFMETPAAAFFKGHGKPTEAWRNFGVVLWHWADLGFGPFAVTLKDDNTCIGLVGPKCPPGWPEGEITWMVFGAAEGNGIATEAAHAVLGFAANDLGWTTAVSYVDAPNRRSIALAERLGASLDETAEAPGPDLLVYRHALPVAEAA
jgi:RimJ/RimL family protein N-acetyltransferase